jgi:phospholipase C
MRITWLACILGFCSVVLTLADCNSAGTSSVASPPLSLQPESIGSSPSSMPSSSPSSMPSSTPSSMPSSSPSGPPSPSPIQHVVIVIQENRTFNDFFATFPGADGTITGRVVRNTNCLPPIVHNEIIPLNKVSLIVPRDLEHAFAGYRIAYDDGKMDAFDNIRFEDHRFECTYPYQYTDPNEIQPYWDLAQQYTLAEHMFTTQGSGSFTAHQDLIRGGTIVEPGKAMVDLPSCSGSRCRWGCDAPPGTYTHLITEGDRYLTTFGPRPCSRLFKSPYLTLRDLLDAKYVSWKYYVPPSDSTMGKLMSAFDVIYPVRRGPEWKTNVITPQTQIFNDITAGTLPAVSWLIPDLDDSDHPGQSQDTGPEWVATVVNAIGLSSYWNSTAIIIVWDDWGGLYDDLGELSSHRFGYGGLGPRVPAIIVSPYAKAGYVSPTDYEFGSILKYIEDNWNLGSLGTSDQRATSIIDCFDYLQLPIKFRLIPSSLDKSYFMHRTPSYEPIDDDM